MRDTGTSLNLAAFARNGGNHFKDPCCQFESTVHVRILAEGRGKRIRVNVFKPFLRRDALAAVHAQVKRIVADKRKSACGIIHLMAADAQIVEDSVQSIGSDFVLEFAKAHRMHNKLGFYTSKALGRKSHRIFVTVKSVERSLFV